MSQLYRRERLEELLWQELNSIISYELADPRLAGISVSRVEVTRDLQVAKIYIAPLDEDIDEGALMRGLESARGHLRSQIVARIQLRRAPDLVFRLDRGQLYAQRVADILDALPPPGDDDEDHSMDEVN